jgi:hypothetical protein
VSVAAFGPDTWLAFARLPEQVRAFLGPAGELHGSMISFMGAALALDVPHDAALCACAVIASPCFTVTTLYYWALRMAWIAADAVRTGFLPWEKRARLLVYLSPLATMPAFMTGNVSIDMPFVLLLWLAWRRAGHPGGGAAAPE